MNHYILSIILFLPLLGAAVLAFVPQRDVGVARGLALGTVILDFLLALGLLPGFSGGVGVFQFKEIIPWISTFGINYFLGVDGISLFMVLLTTFLSIPIIWAAWSVRERSRDFFILLLVLETASLGTFLSLNLFLFYIFWELMLIPVYLLIVGWGGPARKAAAMKFIVYSLFASLFLLLGIVTLEVITAVNLGHPVLDVTTLAGLSLPFAYQVWLFLAFSLAFAVKIPLFPFHAWMPGAYLESPAPATAALSGILSKAGIYGFLRFSFLLFPAAAVHFWPLVAGLGLVGMLYGAFVALTAKDAKKVVAFSSFSHVNLIVLGIFAFNLQGMEGGVLQMVNHGIIAVALFLLIGMAEERGWTRDLDRLGGFARKTPVFAGFFLLAALAALGLPGLNGFAGELLLLLGVFKVHPWLAVVAMLAVILASAYGIRLLQRIFHGPLPSDAGGRDLHWREVAVLAPLFLLIVGLGWWPQPISVTSAASAQRTLTVVRRGSALGNALSVAGLSLPNRHGGDVKVALAAQPLVYYGGGPVSPVESHGGGLQ